MDIVVSTAYGFIVLTVFLFIVLTYLSSAFACFVSFAFGGGMRKDYSVISFAARIFGEITGISFQAVAILSLSNLFFGKFAWIKERCIFSVFVGALVYLEFFLSCRRKHIKEERKEIKKKMKKKMKKEKITEEIE